MSGLAPRGCRWLAVFVGLLAVLSVLGGCSNCSGDKRDDGTAPVSGKLPELKLTDDTPDLLLTWIDERGDFHVVQHPADVPDKGRAAVRVVTPKAGDGDLLYVADLRNKRPDGTYPVRTMPRSEWESIAEKRRKARMEALAPKPSSPSTQKQVPVPKEPAASVTAIVYGASWCSACRGAERFLRSQGVRVVFKDIEKTPGARKEMQQKLAKAGMRDRGSIPVIDVQGQMLIGFDQAALRRAIRRATHGDML